MNLNQLGLNLILFPYLASKLPMAAVTKKDSRLDQGEEGQGIVFSVNYLWHGVFGHTQSTSAICYHKKFETAKVWDIRLVWKIKEPTKSYKEGKSEL